MLELTKQDGTPIKAFDGYIELSQYITHQEHAKLGKSPPESWKTGWSFRVLSPDNVAHLINTLKKSYNEKLLYDAWHRQLPFVEVCEGKEKVHQVIVEPNVNIEALREDWCHYYCEAHGMDITKVN